MKRNIRFWLLWMVMTLLICGSTVSVSAAEADSPAAGSTVTDDSIAQAAAPKKGWVTEGGFKFYYSSSGKIYTGWKKIGKYTYYFRKKTTEEAPVGSCMKGFQKIGNYTYYFNTKGVMLTGWRTIGGKTYYFTQTGKLGTLGRMYIGFQKINKKYFYFNSDGSVATGWTKIKGKLYYFSKSSKLGTKGTAYTGWKKVGKYKYYFSSKGLRYTSRWISGKYYVDDHGSMLVSCVTPDGYVVNSSGAKVKKANGWIKQDGHYYYYVSGKKVTSKWKKISGKYYYFNADGIRQNGWLTVNGATYYLKKYVRQTGWQTIGGQKYYFYSNGKMAKNTEINGIPIGEDGVVGKKSGVSVLLIAGHGQGDCGAYQAYGSTTYYEYKYTREFATLIYNQLNAAGSGIKVTMYDQNYDCYQQTSKTLGSSGLKIDFTGNGSKKDQVYKGILTNSKIPDFTQYDYVLEIHFNATAVANKDPKGDGNYKGIGMYINQYKKDYSIDSKIVSNVVNKTKFKTWGGILKSAGLFNAKTCQELGVSYGLLETAFIDDKDDMTFYNKNKDEMAKAVAEAICSYFGA